MDTYEDDEWISAYNFLEPLEDLSTFNMYMRDTFDENIFLMDGFLHDKWQGVLQAVDPPPYFERTKRAHTENHFSDSTHPFEEENKLSRPSSLQTRTTSVAPAPTASVVSAQTHTTIAPAAETGKSVQRTPGSAPHGHAPLMNSRCIANFVRDMFCEHGDSVGEVAQYFCYFILDVDNKGPLDIAQLSIKYGVPEHDLRMIWNFRPGHRRYNKGQVALKLNMTVPDMTKAYFALGFKTWML
jgi:hypothetical protein